MISNYRQSGDVKTTITHPATTTHGRLMPEARRLPESKMASSGFSGAGSYSDIKKDLLKGLV